MEIIRIPIDELTPDPNNAKDHPDWQIEQIRNSIEQFGNLDPIGVWGDDNLIVEGHGRYEALRDLGYTEAECIRLDTLTDEERRAYALAHNKLTMNSGWIPEALDLNLESIGGIDMSLFGFRGSQDWFSTREINDKSGQDGNDEYNEFIEKFEQKKTTDDCYTPELVYNAVADWVAEEYQIDRNKFVRPFFPGGDYQNHKYPDGCIVVDNPPFSILAEILKWYTAHEIRFFLFAPTLTLFSSCASVPVCALPCGGNITYENGAVVATSFVTNLEENRVRVIPGLFKVVEAANEENQAQFKKVLPKYKYPDEVLTSSMCRYMCEHDTPLTISRADSFHIWHLDSQKEYNDSAIFGSGYLLSEKAAAEKAAAEKAAAEKAAAEKAAAEKAAVEKENAHVWELSDREMEIVRSLGGDTDDKS